MEEVRAQKGQRVPASSSVPTGTGVNRATLTRNSQIGTWLEGVQGDEGTSTNLPHPTWPQWDPVVLNVPVPPEGLAASGATLLTEMRLDQNSTQYVTAQAMKAKAKLSSHGHSVPCEFSTDAQSLFVGQQPPTYGTVNAEACAVTMGHMMQTNMPRHKQQL